MVYPISYLGWYKFYIARFNKTEDPDAVYLAMLNLNFHFADGGELE